jgi:hypothetical protein
MQWKVLHLHRLVRGKMCMNNVCHEIFNCIMRKVSLFTVQFVAQSVTDYSTYVVNIVTHIENIHATLSTGMYRQI